jgi:hypothetical protein
MDNGLRCWKCGASLADYSLPLRRLEECRACRAELHACRMCEFYDTSKAKHCRETVAEEDYFRPTPAAYQAAAVSAADRAKAELEALFGRK